MTYENPYMKGRTWPELNILETLRHRNPLVICITNDVVRTFTANGLLAIGASPVMSECSEDLKDLIVHASALLINIGTLTPDKVSYYKEAIKLAKTHEVPVVLDPVGCHAGAYRLSVVLDLIKTGHLSLLRGNQSEIKAIYDALSPDDMANNSTTGKGVDGAQVEDSCLSSGTSYQLSCGSNGRRGLCFRWNSRICSASWTPCYDSRNGYGLSIRCRTSRLL